MESMRKMKDPFVKDGINPLYVLSLINQVGYFSYVSLLPDLSFFF